MTVDGSWTSFQKISYSLGIGTQGVSDELSFTALLQESCALPFSRSTSVSAVVSIVVSQVARIGPRTGDRYFICIHAPQQNLTASFQEMAHASCFFPLANPPCIDLRISPSLASFEAEDERNDANDPRAGKGRRSLVGWVTGLLGRLLVGFQGGRPQTLFPAGDMCRLSRQLTLSCS